ncbi:MAG: cupin-like domain-containing protein, partial [Candidatus Sericytochromatia bacterium]|nr:cupin-like domain-containing protein [Candidatus Sericytochromatia bacterium]
GPWSPGTPRARLARRPVRAAVLGPGGVTSLDYSQETPMLFAELADRLVSQVGRPAQAGDVYLAQGGSLMGDEPAIRALLAEVVVPQVPLAISAANLWIGSGGNVSYLHFDPMENVLAMLCGRKKLVLIPPDQTHHVYPIYDPDPLGSATDLRRPDFAKHPGLHLATYSEVVLEAGEALFIPLGWWHHVASEGLNIAVNVWWYPRHVRWLLNAPMRGLFLSQLTSRQGLKRLLKVKWKALRQLCSFAPMRRYA